MRILFKRILIYVLVLLTLLVIFNQRSINTSFADSLIHIKAPSIAAANWLNSAPLNNAALAGKVFLLEFWTYGCYNCRNVEPYVKSWYQKYNQQGFEVVAVHSPEFDREADISNVSEYTKKNGIHYPVAIDNDFSIWNRYSNRYWPAMYLVDKKGVIRYYHFGEGSYAATEKMIQSLLQE